jgi:hypothetical protein
MFHSYSMKPIVSLILLGFSLTIVGCNRQEDIAKVRPSNPAPATAATAQTPVGTTSQQEAEPNIAKSPQTTKADIPPGRYWIGSTDQALDVEGEQYRYLDAEVEQPWRSASELQVVKAGVIYDGKNYWCLSTMAPKSGGAIACSENGWVTAVVSEPETRDGRKQLFSCWTKDTKQISLYDAGDTIEYRFGKVEYPLGQPPKFVADLELKVPRAEVENYQWSGFGRNMTYYVTVPNGNVRYRVFWSLDKLDKTQTPEGGVEVIENGTSIATVNCQGEMVNNLQGFAL